MLGMNYAPAEDPLPDLHARDKGVISVYAQRRDYHDVIKKKLKNIARWMVAQSELDVKVFVDTHRSWKSRWPPPRTGLAGQAHQSCVADLAHGCFWAVFSPLPCCLSMRRKPTIAAAVRRVWIFAPQGVSRALQAGCAPVHFLSDHRTQRHDTDRISRCDGQSYLWLR